MKISEKKLNFNSITVFVDSRKVLKIYFSTTRQVQEKTSVGFWCAYTIEMISTHSVKDVSVRHVCLLILRALSGQVCNKKYLLIWWIFSPIEKINIVNVHSMGIAANLLWNETELYFGNITLILHDTLWKVQIISKTRILKSLSPAFVTFTITRQCRVGNALLSLPRLLIGYLKIIKSNWKLIVQ